MGIHRDDDRFWHDWQALPWHASEARQHPGCGQRGEVSPPRRNSEGQLQDLGAADPRALRWQNPASKIHAIGHRNPSRFMDVCDGKHRAWRQTFASPFASTHKQKTPQNLNSAGFRRHDWRRRRDSNPRSRFWPRCSLSRGVPSTSRPRLPKTSFAPGRQRNEAKIIAG